jgi:hypothetical protein
VSWAKRCASFIPCPAQARDVPSEDPCALDRITHSTFRTRTPRNSATEPGIKAKTSRLVPVVGLSSNALYAWREEASGHRHPALIIVPIKLRKLLRALVDGPSKKALISVLLVPSFPNDVH